MKIDHKWIAVKSIAEAAQVYEQALGLTVAGYDQVMKQLGVRLRCLNRRKYIELLESSSRIPYEKFMSRRGEGLHHIAVRVDNIEEALER